MTTEQINEALAHLSVSPSRRQPVETWDEAWFESFDVVLAAARDHLTCLRDWVTCPTCGGNGTYIEEYEQGYETPLRVTKPCPDCVGGLQPSAELVERVARGIGFLDFDLPFEFCLRAAWAALLASRQGDTT